MAGQAFNDRVGNLSLEKKLGSITDTVNRSNWITLRVMSAPKRWSGKVINQVITTTNSSNGQFFNGVQQVNTDIEYTNKQLSWYPTGFIQPVAVSKVDKALSNTEAGVLSVEQATADWSANSMRTRLASAFYGLGQGDQFEGLGNTIDDGTSSSSYGGLSRATFGSFINSTVTAASGGILDLDLLASVDDAATVSGVAEMQPNVVLTTKSIWSLYESLLEPTKKAEYRSYGYPTVTGTTAIGEMQRGETLGASGGFQSLDFRGKPMIRDEAATSGTLFFVNEFNTEFHSLKIPGFKTVAFDNKVNKGFYDKVRATSFQWFDSVTPYNTPTAEVGYLMAYGNLIHRDPRLNAKATGVTTT